MACPSFRINYGMRAELCQKPFENLMNRAILWIPKISALLLEQEDVLLQEKSFSEQRCEQCMGGEGGGGGPNVGAIGSPRYPSRTLPRGKQRLEKCRVGRQQRKTCLTRVYPSTQGRWNIVVVAPLSPWNRIYVACSSESLPGV